MRYLFTTLLLLLTGACWGQAQQHFRHTIPAGNYSGISALGNDRYAVVSDKSAEDGFFVFHIVVDSAKRRIAKAENEGFRSSGLPNRDQEAISYCPSTGTLFIAGEADNEVVEYTLEGLRTGRRLALPAELKSARRNLGLESLTYDAGRHCFFTTTERPLKGDSVLRIMAVSDDLRTIKTYVYTPDAPISPKHYHGVAELCALDDGRLLVMERQLKVPRLKIGAVATVRIYEVNPGEQAVLEKRLLTEFKTRLTLTSRKFANFEGMCPLGSNRLLLIADSQNQYKGVLRDWFRIVDLNE